MSDDYIQIVNDEDEIIGHKRRSEVDYQKNIYRISALWMTNSRGEILIAQRKLTKDKDPGKWGPAVAGTVEQNETYESNNYKEAEEEIGLTGVKFKVGQKQKINKAHKIFVQWFLINIDKNINEFKIQEDEVEQLAWKSKDELLSEIKENPKMYLPSMPDIVKLLI